MARTTIDADYDPRPSPIILVLAVLGAAIATSEILPGSMMPLMATGLNTSEGMIGQAVTASAIVAIITSLSISRIAGNRDRRLILIALTITLVISNIGVVTAQSVWIMLASRLLLGATVGIIWGLVPAIVLRLAPEGQFARSFATVLVGVSIAGVIAAPLAAYIGAMFGWRSVYLGATALALVALGMLVVTFPPMPTRPGTLKRNLGSTLRLPGLIPGMAGIMLLFGGLQAFNGYLVPFLESVTGLGAGAISITLLLIGVAGLLGTLIAPRLLAISIYKVMVLAPAMLVVLMGILLISGHLVLPAAAILAMWSLARAHIGVGANAWVAQNYADHAEGAGGILVAVIQGSMMLGAILGGVLIDTTGARAPLVAGAILLGLGSVHCFQALRPLAPDDDIEPLHSPTTTLVETQIVIEDEPA